jgi:hypothetical protein
MLTLKAFSKVIIEKILEESRKKESIIGRLIIIKKES